MKADYTELKPGTPVWMVKVTNLKTPIHVLIEKGYVAYSDYFQYWISFSKKKYVSAQPEDLFPTEKEALDYLIIWLESHLAVYEKRREELGK